MAICACTFACGSGIALSIIDRIGPIIPEAAVEAAVPAAEAKSWRIFAMLELLVWGLLGFAIGWLLAGNKKND